jgi:hypothetical protein
MRTVRRKSMEGTHMYGNLGQETDKFPESFRVFFVLRFQLKYPPDAFKMIKLAQELERCVNLSGHECKIALTSSLYPSGSLLIRF